MREEEKAEPPQPEPGIVAVSESESEEEEDDDIFDTTYIDAIATGEVKLAYIPGENCWKTMATFHNYCYE